MLIILSIDCGCCSGSEKIGTTGEKLLSLPRTNAILFLTIFLLKSIVYTCNVQDNYFYKSVTLTVLSCTITNLRKI